MSARPALYVVRSRDITNPQRPPRWHGRSDTLGLTEGAPSPVGLRGWRFWGDAQRALDSYVGLMVAVMGGAHRSYEVVKMGPVEVTR